MSGNFGRIYIGVEKSSGSDVDVNSGKEALETANRQVKELIKAIGNFSWVTPNTGIARLKEPSEVKNALRDDYTGEQEYSLTFTYRDGENATSRRPFLKIPVTPDNMDRVIAAIEKARDEGIDFKNELVRNGGSKAMDTKQSETVAKFINGVLLDEITPLAGIPVVANNRGSSNQIKR